MNGLLMFLAAVCVLTPLIALHEWGHYIVARLCGVKVLTYSIGMGPRLFGWTSKKTGIDYRISVLPLGGYVKMLDEREGEVAESEKHLAFNNTHPLKKIAIVIAGPVMNFLIAIALFFVLFLQPSEQLNTKIGQLLPDSPAASSHLTLGDKITHIDGKSVQTWEEVAYALGDRMGETGVVNVGVLHEKDNAKSVSQTIPVAITSFMQHAKHTQQDPLSDFGVLPYQPMLAPVIGQVVPKGAADVMGLKTGDKVLSINQIQVNSWQEVAKIIRQSPDEFLVFSVQRANQVLDVRVLPNAVMDKDGKKIGQIGVQVAYDPDTAIPAQYRMTVKHTPSQAFDKALGKTYDLAMMTLGSIKKMMMGLIGLEHLSGPIAIAEVSKNSFEIGWQQVLSTAALLSLSLAVLNLLPIPVLDGGHLVFYTYELVAGKPMPQSMQMNALKIGALMLFCFMALAISNDVMRIFG
ncbi:RIP metalloprotease RseP [Moraxella sp.]|uniref:RIP metalloprotease RseP n=1 Tax=Moraxella sp. TaxID=479 RepID=UPI0026DD0C08|nr:RIP metalloprotease RseP [Moraxella sp.]MDO4895306.1 RIP metalloprotease RseP [Moraxella sp.]